METCTSWNATAPRPHQVTSMSHRTLNRGSTIHIPTGSTTEPTISKSLQCDQQQRQPKQHHREQQHKGEQQHQQQPGGLTKVRKLNRRISLPSKCFTSIKEEQVVVEEISPLISQLPHLKKGAKARSFSLGAIPRKPTYYTGGTYMPGFISVLPPEKTKHWHFSSHEKALLKAGINPKDFILTNLSQLKAKYGPPKVSVEGLTTEETEPLQLQTNNQPGMINSAAVREPSEISRSRGNHRLKPHGKWEDEVKVDHQPFVEYLRNVAENPDEYIEFEAQEKNRRLSKQLPLPVTSMQKLLTQKDKPAEQNLIIQAAYSLCAGFLDPSLIKKVRERDESQLQRISTVNDLIRDQQSEKMEITLDVDQLGLSPLQKSRQMLLAYLNKLTTAQIVKARELAIKELGQQEFSINNFTKTFQNCAYIRPAAGRY